MVLWLSDAAWDSLSLAAFSMGWIRQVNTISQPGYTSRHIGRYFEAISSLEYQDTRPEQLHDTGVWQQGDRTHAHRVAVSYEALSALATTAASYRIPPRWYAAMLLNERVLPSPDRAVYAAVLANAKTGLPNMAAATLEAIGCSYLTADVYPAAPPGLFKQPDRAKTTKLQQAVAYRFSY